MIVSRAHIESYIPQRPPFLMVDNLLETGEGHFVTDFRIQSGNIFLEDGVLREYALIENMAQSGAAGIGYMNSATRSGPTDGFIGAISKLTVYDLPREGDTIRTDVTLVSRFGNMYLLAGACYLDDKKLMECEIKLAGLTP